MPLLWMTPGDDEDDDDGGDKDKDKDKDDGDGDGDSDFENFYDNVSCYFCCFFTS